jgi:biopolymer transport protein TolR
MLATPVGNLNTKEKQGVLTMGMAIGGGKGAVANINMTPMIDVLLVLIIIFMVITPLTPKGLEALVPQPAPPNQPQNDADQRTVVVTVNKDRSMLINNEATDMAKLGPRLEEIFKTRAERVIFVKGDPDLEFQDVAKVIDIAKGVGIDKVGLMTPQMEAGN